MIHPLAIHGSRFSTDVDGYIVTLTAPLLASLQAHLGNQQAVLARPDLYPVSDREQGYVDTLFAAITNEYAPPAPTPERDLLLQSLIAVLAVWLCRQRSVPRAGEHGIGGRVASEPANTWPASPNCSKNIFESIGQSMSMRADSISLRCT